jgi:flagellar basal body-associated protein FliL
MATPEGDENVATPRAGLVPLSAVGVVALAAGAGVGRLVVAPRLGPSSAAGAEGAAADDGHGGSATAQHQFRIDGVIVNPAGTRGQHHLIVSVAFEVGSVEDHSALKAAEVALRDRIGSLLERRSVDALSAPGARDGLRSELAALAADYVHGRPVQVFLPQYILQ